MTKAFYWDQRPAIDSNYSYDSKIENISTQLKLEPF